jgi:cysteine sulfinate desulfinase/cysteine desulfurase-like protein
LYDAGVDTVTVSFHKICGPHLGLLLYADKTKLRPLVHGTQQNSLRGGTLSAPIISAAYYAYMRNLNNNTLYQNQLQMHRRSILQQLVASPIKVLDIADAVISPDNWLHTRPDGVITDLYATYHIQIFGLAGTNVLPNTILMIVYDPRGRFCNVECKKYLDTHDIIIGIGSACLTSKPAASHVADAYNLNKLQKRGIMRLSFIPKLKNCEYAIGMLITYLANFI